MRRYSTRPCLSTTELNSRPCGIACRCKVGPRADGATGRQPILLCLRLNSTVSSDEAQVALAQRLFDQATHLEDAGAGTGLDTLRANQKLKRQQQALIVAREEARRHSMNWCAC